MEREERERKQKAGREVGWGSSDDASQERVLAASLPFGKVGLLGLPLSPIRRSSPLVALLFDTVFVVFTPPLRYMYRRMRKCMVHIPKIQTTQTDVESYLVHCVTRCTSQYITTPNTRFFCYSFYIYSPVAISSFILAIAAAGLRPLGHVRVHYAIVSMISNAQCQYAYVEDGVASVKRHGVLHLLLSLGAVRILLVRLC